MITAAAFSGDYRMMLSASPLGMVVGLDVGADFVLSTLPAASTAALPTAGVSPVPQYLPMLRLAAAKGLPFGLNLGFGYISDSAGNLLIGGALNWAFVPGDILRPAIALRVGYNLGNISFIQTRTTKIDLLLSKRFGGLLDPYLGFGAYYVTGSLNVPIGGATGLPLTISGNAAVWAGHFMVGLPIKLGFIKITAEYDYSFLGQTAYGLRGTLSL